jgi:hypothetical protein
VKRGSAAWFKTLAKADKTLAKAERSHAGRFQKALNELK